MVETTAWRSELSTALVTREQIEYIAVLTLNNPEKRNALSSAVLSALKDELDSVGRDPAIHAVVLRAEGPVFSSGHDLRELVDGDEDDAAHVFNTCIGVMEGIRLLPQPVIAQVHGLATAAGCELVATCDLAVASEDASFATPGVEIGLFCTTPGVAVGRAVPAKKAMEMLLTGEPLSAREALEVGLVNRVVPAEELEEQTMALARTVASSSSSVVALGKAAFYRQMAMDRPTAYKFAGRVMVDNLLNPNAREGIAAFLEKRRATWSD